MSLGTIRLDRAPKSTTTTVDPATSAIPESVPKDSRAARVRALFPDRVESSSSNRAYRGEIAAFVAAERAEIAAAGLVERPGTGSITRFHAGPAKGLLVLLHGLSSSPAQWSHLVDDAFARGHDVFVPRLPGHGLLDAAGREDTSLVPSARAWERWDAFAERVWGLARTSGHVTVAGLSCGGMLALKMAERHGHEASSSGEPVLSRVVAVSPYLAFAGRGNQLLAGAMHGLGAVAPGLVDRFLSSREVVIGGKNPERIPDGFRVVNQSQALAMDSAAEEVREGAKRLVGVPVELVMSEADDQADPAAMKALAREAGIDATVFPKGRGVPHGMISPHENPDQGSVALVRALILGKL